MLLSFIKVILITRVLVFMFIYSRKLTVEFLATFFVEDLEKEISELFNQKQVFYQKRQSQISIPEYVNTILCPNTFMYLTRGC